MKYPAKTIDEVIENLDLIIDQAKLISSPMGYFAVLYRRVTLSVKENINQGKFDNNNRTMKLIVNFANRYFAAGVSWSENRPPSQSWHVSFETNGRRWPVVLQHLLLGIHAHINLDLGIVAVETAGGPELKRIKNDFDRINNLLASQLDEVKANMGGINPLMHIAYPVISRFDEFMMDFNINTARDGTWKFAERLNTATPEQRQELIDDRDLRIAELARRMADPGKRLSYLLAVVRLGEWRSVEANMRRLGE